MRTIYVNASTAHVGGALTYIRGWLKNLSDSGTRSFRYVFFVNRDVFAEFPVQDHGVRVISAISSGGRPSLWTRATWDQVGLNKLLQERPAILFSAANVALLRSPIPQILLVRQSLYLSDNFVRRILPQRPILSRLAERLRRKYLIRSIRAADHILVPSVAMRDAIVEALPREAAKVAVLPYVTDLPAASPQRAVPAPKRNFTFVFPSHYADYKNFKHLLLAAKLLVSRGYKFRIRLNAEPERFPKNVSAWHAEDCALFNDPKLTDVIDRVGPQSRSEVLKSLRSCDALVIPSFAESYGHPFLEGMSQGLPVAASDLPISREVAGPAAIYFDPWDPESIAEVMQRLICDEELRDSLRETGLRRVQARGWVDYIHEFESYCAQIK